MTKLKNRVFSLKKMQAFQHNGHNLQNSEKNFHFPERLQIFAKKNSNMLYDPNFFKTDGVTVTLMQQQSSSFFKIYATFCQGQPQPQLHLRWCELALISTKTSTLTHIGNEMSIYRFILGHNQNCLIKLTKRSRINFYQIDHINMFKSSLTGGQSPQKYCNLM